METEATTRLERRDGALTPALVRVIREVTGGYSNEEIAKRLNLSPYTVKLHIQAIMKQLGIHNRTHLAIYALKTGLISLDEIEMPDRTKDQQEQQ